MKLTYVFIIVLILISVTFISTAYATQPFWSTVPSTQTIERHDSLTGFDITKYDLILNINDQTHFLRGSVEAEVTAENNLSAIEYNLMGGTLTVTEVKVNDVVGTFTHQNGIIHIPLNITAGQQFTTKVSYEGIPANSPAPYNIGMLFTASAVYTLSNPDAGRYWWPSYDHPWDKALIDLHITVRNDWLVAGNGLRQNIVSNEDGTKTHNWICSHPVATYVVGMAAGPYIEFNQQAGTLPIQNFVLPSQLANATADFANVPEMIDYFSTVYGAYPFEKYGHALVNMSTYAAMEHQTMTTFGSQYITGNQTYESTVAHELAHQWMGNCVTPLTMQDVWLKESFATYSEFLWLSHHAGWQAACDFMNSSIHNYYIGWENSNGAHTIYNPVYNELFAPPTYEKSASVLHMLRLKLGNANFSSFAQTWFNTYQNSNVISAEIKAMAEQVSGIDLDQFFQQWIYSPGIPSANFTIFIDGVANAKIIAQSTSPTSTQFDFEIPLMLPGSTLMDSVVVRATPQGYVNIMPYNPVLDNLSSLQIDPNHWTLNRGFTTNTFQLTACLPANHRVTLVWNALVCPTSLVGYNVSRKTMPNGQWSLLNATPVTLLTYTDLTPENGTSYQYHITAVDNEGYQSLPSNAMNATPLEFPFDWGFMVVDETKDGSGSALSPNDQMVDGFYSSVLQGMPFSQWDYATMGAPSLNTLSHYALVLWHSDDFSEFLIDDNINTLGSYIISGGKLLVSGWKYPSAIPQSFFDQFFPGVTPALHNQPVFVSAQSDSYPDLHPDPAKLTASWNGMLSMAYTFPNAGQALYTAEISGGGAGNNEPVAIRADNVGTVVLLGFPLYYMLETEVHSFLVQLLPLLYPNVGVEDETNPPAALSVFCYPNPFTDKLKISIAGKQNSNANITIFNIKGQKVTEWYTDDTKDNMWKGTDIDNKPVGSGIYLIKVSNSKETIFRKIIKIQ